MNVALYARVSTKDKGQDTENQLRELREYCNNSKLIIYDEFVDQVSAGGDKVRVRFEEMMTSAYQRKFGLVMFWSLDRFSREGVQKTFNHLQRLNEYGVKWKSYKEPFLDTTSPMGEAIVAIFAAIARQERIRIGERVKAGMDTAKQKGIRLGRKAVTDEGRHRKGKKVATVRLEDVIRLKQEGMSLRQIAESTGVSKDSVARLLLSQKPLLDAVA